MFGKTKVLKRRSISVCLYPSSRSDLRMNRHLLALISLFLTWVENLLSHWKVTPKITTSLHLGIIAIGE